MSDVLVVELDEGDSPPFPFLIAGFVADDLARCEALFAAFTRRVATIPPGMAVWHHQHGGYACDQATLVGYGVDVPADGAVRAAIAEIIDHVGITSGERIEPHSLRRWDGALRAMLPGGAQRGKEALLRSGEGPPIGCLRGLPIVRVEPEHAGVTRVEVNFDAAVTLEGTYDDAHERALTEVGAELGLTPMVALLWGNSD